MKISKQALVELIKEELREGVERVEDETIITGPEGDSSPEARAAARLQDLPQTYEKETSIEEIISFLESSNKLVMADLLRPLKSWLDLLQTGREENA
tara:strand:+ start:197 stop:487 length:291 start_codon:yes stop_codon:yes gene_type:complete